jgi:hypothetical protein
MPTGPGEAQGILHRTAVLEPAQLFFSQEMEQFPLQRTFFGMNEDGSSDAALFTEDEYEYVYGENMRRVASWRSKAAASDATDGQQIGSAKARPLHQALHTDLTKDQTRKYGRLGELGPIAPGMDPAMMLAVNGALRPVEAAQRQHFRQFLQTREVATGKMLKEAGDYTLSVDGDDVTFNQGLNQLVTEDDWINSTSAKVVSGMSRLIRLHKRACGWNPTHAIFHDSLREILEKNDDFLAFVNRFPDIMFENTLPLPTRSAGNRPMEIEIGNQYRAESKDSSTLVDVWDAGVLTLVTKRERQTFYHATEASEDNNWQGGIQAYTIQLEDPRVRRVVSTDVVAQGVKEGKYVSRCLLTGP